MLYNFEIENPTSKFGDALRSQVEERLAFFETGAAPSKNSEAMRKVLESLAMDDDEESDVEMDGVGNSTLPLIDASPQKENGKIKKSKEEKKKEKEEKKKKRKEEKKSKDTVDKGATDGKEGKEKKKKRKADAMDVDEEVVTEQPTEKKAKLSKEEKKALKKAKKAEGKDVTAKVCSECLSRFFDLMDFLQEADGDKKKHKKDKKRKEAKAVASDSD